MRSETDLALCLGVLRPGASTTRPRLLAAIHGGTTALDGWDQLTRDHQQQISAVLSASRGSFVFDEDLLRVVHLLGLSFADAERLRKALKRGEEYAATHLNKLRAAALERGWHNREIDVVIGWFRYIHRYCFTRGHALALAYAAWRVAYLAAHYSNYFFAATLDHLGDEGGGMYPPLVYVVEARKRSLQVVGPTINSPWESRARERTISCGLALLRRVIAVEVLRCGCQVPSPSISECCGSPCARGIHRSPSRAADLCRRARYSGAVTSSRALGSAPRRRDGATSCTCGGAGRAPACGAGIYS